MTQTSYTVVMRPDDVVSDTTLERVRTALGTLDNATITKVERMNALGMDTREVLITAVITYSVTVAANLTSTAITEALYRDEVTQSIQVQDVYKSTDDENDVTPPPESKPEP